MSRSGWGAQSEADRLLQLFPPQPTPGPVMNPVPYFSHSFTIHAPAYITGKELVHIRACFQGYCTITFWVTKWYQTMLRIPNGFDEFIWFLIPDKYLNPLETVNRMFRFVSLWLGRSVWSWPTSSAFSPPTHAWPGYESSSLFLSLLHNSCSCIHHWQGAGSYKGLFSGLLHHYVLGHKVISDYATDSKWI